MVSPTKEFSQITPSAVPPVNTDQFVGVTAGPNDVLFSLTQLKAAIPPGAQGPTGLPGPTGPQGPPGVVSGVPDPLTLTQGLQLASVNPTIGGDPNYRRAMDINTTFNQLNSNPGFTTQAALGVQLNFKEGLNIFSSGPDGTQAKYTPVALNVGGTFIGAGEKFMLGLTGNFFSMGDSFMMSGNTVYAGGPIGGDEGQGWSPAMQLLQPNGAAQDTITLVVQTTYNATLTAPVVGSYIAQNLAVSTTVGASVGDWVVLNQTVPSNNSTIWAMQILAINPGVSINGVCPVNLAAGTTITPALCLNLGGGGQQFGEGRTLVDLSGASYSTGTVTSIVGGAFNGSGTTWANNMVGGNALNIGAIYLDIDTLSTTPFTVGAPCRSIYQITTIVNPTQLGIFSNSAAGDLSYQGRGAGKTGLTYKIVPAARVLLVNPTGGTTTYTVICETSTHTWTIGDIVECAICPYPDVHGWDYRVSEWTAGGNRRFLLGLENSGARTFDTGILFSSQPTFIGNPATPQYDGFSWNTAVNINSAKNPMVITAATSSDGTTYVGGPAITIISIYGTGADSAISWPGHSTASLVQNAANGGMDFTMGGNGLLRSIAASVNADTHRPQLTWSGYLQLTSFSSFSPYLRIGGTNGASDSITGTFDLAITTDGITASNTLQFNVNTPTSNGLFGVTSGGSGWFAGANVPAAVPATNGVNQPSQVMQMSASVWNGSAAVNRTCQVVAVPDSLSATNSTVSMQLRVWDSAANNANDPKVPMSISSLGIVKFGNDNFVTGGDRRCALDPTGLTAPRTVTVPDVAGGLGVVVPGSHTPASSGATGTSGTIEFDGSFLYVCVGANTWVRAALTGGW